MPQPEQVKLFPLGLSMNHRVIFIAARHVGLAFAAAISIEKGCICVWCNTADDIRLYYATTDYIRNKRSGQIAKVDNSIGIRLK